MKKSIAGIILTAATFSGAALADYNQDIRLNVVPVNGGAWVSVEKGGAPQPGLDIKVEGARQEHYTTTESGRVFVQSASEGSRSLSFEVTDENGNMVSTKRFIPSSS